MNQIEQTLQIVKRSGVTRPRDLDSYGIPRVYLYRLYERGLLQRVGRGLYTSAKTNATENHTLAEAYKRVPHGVICLISALRFHNLTTQAPFEVWMAIEPKARLPKVDRPKIRFFRFSNSALTEGIDEYNIEGVSVRIYNPAKTIADCFKYRNKIGIDIAIEALRDIRRERKSSVDQLWYYANICRVSKVMKPYLEAVI